MPIVKLTTGKSIDTDKLQAGWTCRYGRVFKPGITKLQIELMAFRDDWKPGPNGEPWGLGRYEHAKRLIETIWPNYQWTKWSEKKWRALCGYDLAALMGCAGSGKSRDLGMYALLCYWSAPQDTAVAVTSTDIEGAKNRVWGEIVRCHQEAQWLDDNGVRQETPGTITGQPARVGLKSSNDGVRGAGQQSILLVAAGNAFTDAALRTLQGLHNMFVLLILDELQDLTEAIIGDPLLSNLRRNPRFQLVAAGNIGNADDPLGKLCRPVTKEGNGYDDVNEDTEEWEIGRLDMKGVCVRLDAEKTPNYERKAQGLLELRFLPTVAEVEAERAAYLRGEREAGAYYRQWKAFIAPKAAEDGRYSAAIMTKYEAHKRANWATQGGFLSVAGCDPAYTSGGDKFIVYPIRYGLSADGRWTVEFQEPHALQQDNAFGTVRNYAMVKQARALCERNEVGVSPENFAVDVSGENPIGDIFFEEWSDQIMRVNFQGKASDLPVSLSDRRPSHQEYSNKVAELWGALAIFVRHDQVRGIGHQHAKELAARRTWRGAGNKLVVEEKHKMRKRLGYSTDYSDGGNCGLELLRARHGAVAGSDAVIRDSNAQRRLQERNQIVPVRLTGRVGIAHVRRW